MRGLAVERQFEIFRRAAAQAGLALAVVGKGEQREQPSQKDEDQAGMQVSFYSFVQAPIIMKGVRNWKPSLSRFPRIGNPILVSAIIPARNEEESIRRAVESVAAQAEIGEVIVVNDQSTDGTAKILAELAARIPKVRLIAIEALPAGWTGKNYALAMGAARATGDWLLFTDADTYHYPGSARRALADAVDHDAVLVSYSPEQEMETWWERALIPYVYCRLAAKFSYARVNDAAAGDAAANGQFLMILRDVYKGVGGHTAVAGLVLEDVALARRMKAAGHRIYFTAPIGIVRTRMYRDFRSMWEGWTKNLYLLMGGTPGVLAREFAPWLVTAVVIVFWGDLLLRHPGNLWTLPAAIAGVLIGGHLKYAAELYRNLYPVQYIKYWVAGVCLFSAALVVSWWKTTQGSVVWKGRAYPAKAA